MYQQAIHVSYKAVITCRHIIWASERFANLLCFDIVDLGDRKSTQPVKKPALGTRKGSFLQTWPNLE